MPNSIKNPRLRKGKTAYLNVCYAFLDRETADKKTANNEGNLYYFEC